MIEADGTIAVRVTIERFDPDDGRSYESVFDVRIPRSDHVLNLLAVIQRDHEPALSYPSHFCKVGTCGACTLRVDGRPALGCRTLVRAAAISIGPAKGRRVLADLLTSEMRETWR